MSKKVLIAALCWSLIYTIMAADAFAISPDQRSQASEQLHDKIERLGTGRDALIALRLKDKSVVSGFVTQVGYESFVVTDVNTGEQSTVSFEQIGRMQGVNLASKVEVHHKVGIRSKLVRLALFGVPGHQQVQRNNLSGKGTLIVGIILGVILAIVLAKVF